MKPVTRILAATDLSAPARHAMDRGFQLAAASGARYTVLHALHLGALDTLRGPDIALGDLADLAGTQAMLEQVGLL